MTQRGGRLNERPTYHGDDHSLVQQSADEIEDRRFIVRPCNTGTARFATGYEVFDRETRTRIGEPYTYSSYAHQHADELESERTQ